MFLNLSFERGTAKFRNSFSAKSFTPFFRSESNDVVLIVIYFLSLLTYWRTLVALRKEGVKMLTCEV